MPDEYELTLEEIAAQLDRIERRLDLMGQRIAFLDGAFAQMDKRMDFFEDMAFGPKKRADISPDAFTRSSRRFIWTCRIMMGLMIIVDILIFFCLPPWGK